MQALLQVNIINEDKGRFYRTSDSYMKMNQFKIIDLKGSKLM